MATVTPNFGWDIPQSTDLVKDGATAIAALGNDIDTSMVDLKGGTTGQILTKASNTDMDFTWSSETDPNAISKTIVDAKGDLISATAADTPARLAVGTNGQVLTADSTQSTGLKWATPAAGGFFKNPVLNSNFSVWQRGTSFTMSTTAYTADRWQGYRTVSGGTVSRQLTNDTTNLPNIQYCARVQRDSGNTNTAAALYLTQSFESVNSIPFAGKTVTLSFYARAGANYSPTSSALNVQLITGTGTDQNINGTYTGLAAPINTTSTLTTTWQRFSHTATLSSTMTEMGINFYLNPTGTAGANDYFEITGVQLEVGSSATDYYPNGNTYQQELAACQRYYEKSYDQATAPATNATVGQFAVFGSSVANGATYQNVQFKVTKRGAPTVTIYSYNATSGRTSNTSGTDYGADSANVWRSRETDFTLKNNSGSSMTITDQWVYGNWIASAEL